MKTLNLFTSDGRALTDLVSSDRKARGRRKIRNFTEWLGAKWYQQGQLMRSSYRIGGGSNPSHSTARRTTQHLCTRTLPVPSALFAPKA